MAEGNAQVPSPLLQEQRHPLVPCACFTEHSRCAQSLCQPLAVGVWKGTHSLSSGLTVITFPSLSCASLHGSPPTHPCRPSTTLALVLHTIVISLPAPHFALIPRSRAFV
jgi:hypothetical protein